jgi:hypothetical protein
MERGFWMPRGRVTPWPSGRLVDSFRAELQAHCCRIVGTTHDANGVMQEALVDANYSMPPLTEWYERSQLFGGLWGVYGSNVYFTGWVKLAVIQAYRFALDPTPEQGAMLRSHCRGMRRGPGLRSGGRHAELNGKRSEYRALQRWDSHCIRPSW